MYSYVYKKENMLKAGMRWISYYIYIYIYIYTHSILIIVENMRDLSKYFPNYIYNDERKAPTDPEGVEVLEQLIEKLSFEYNPKFFSNPKLQVQIQSVETLALDLEQPELPPDATCKLYYETIHCRKVLCNIV